MFDVTMQFSPRVVLGSADSLASGAREPCERALIINDSSFEAAAEQLRGNLEARGIDTIIFPGENVRGDSVTLEEVLSLARGSRTQMVAGLGGEDILSLVRIAAAAAPGTDRAASIMQKPSIEGEGLPLLEIPAGGLHHLLYHPAAILSDTDGGCPRLIALPRYASHTVIIDPALTEEGPNSRNPADLLAASIESLLSSRSMFFSDIQSRQSILEGTALLRGSGGRGTEENTDTDNPDYRLRLARAALVCGFAGGLTGIPPLMILAMALAPLAGVSRAAVYTVLLPWALESPLYAGSPKRELLSEMLASGGSEPPRPPADEIRSLFGRAGIPGRLRDLGADPGRLFPAPEWAADMLENRGDLDEAAFRSLLELAC